MSGLKVGIWGVLVACFVGGCGPDGFVSDKPMIEGERNGLAVGPKKDPRPADGVCLCGLPELFCEVDGEPGPRCASAEDCDEWCTGGAPSCAPGLGEFPEVCAEQALDCFFVEDACRQ